MMNKTFNNVARLFIQKVINIMFSVVLELSLSFRGYHEYFSQVSVLLLHFRCICVSLVSLPISLALPTTTLHNVVSKFTSKSDHVDNIVPEPKANISMNDLCVGDRETTPLAKIIQILSTFLFMELHFSCAL